jgi:hypothetical protein
MIAQLNRDEIEQLAARYEELRAETELLNLAAESGEGPPLDDRYRRLSTELAKVALQLHYAHASQLLPARP